MSKNTSCPNELKFCEDSWFVISWVLAKFQLIRTTNKKVLFLKKNWHVSIRDFKKQKVWFFNTCFCLRLYSMYGFFENMYCFGMKILGYSSIMTQHFSKGRWSWLRWRQNSLWVDLQLNVQKDVLKCFITASTIMLQSKLSFICN